MKRESSKRHVVIPVFVPHKGCPFDCIYCNQKLISGQINEMSIEKMREIIERILSTAGENMIEIGFYGGSFTGIEKEQQLRFLEAANVYINEGRVESIRLSTRPDYINREILDYLWKYNVRTIELGVQSLDEKVLELSLRGHTTDDVLKASALVKEYGFSLGIQTMTGLPGSSPETETATAEKVAGLKPDIVRIYPTLVIKDTYLERMYREGKFKPQSLEEAVGICSRILEIYENNGINVIRIGLQPTDTINEDMDVIAGPFHPAFRQLVESRLALQKMEREINSGKISEGSSIAIYTGEKNISNVTGQKKTNILYLKKKYLFEDIKVIPLKEMGNDISIILQ